MRFEFIVLALVAVAGCRPFSDLGAECALVKRDPNVDGGRLFVTNGELRGGPGKDFVSIGSAECDDLICVRDSDYAPADGGGLNPNEIATGYCSRNCLRGDPCPSSSSELDGNPRTRMTCRPLLLNAETLRAICSGTAGDRARCEASLGNSTSPDFCARGATGADAGV